MVINEQTVVRLRFSSKLLKAERNPVLDLTKPLYGRSSGLSILDVLSSRSNCGRVFHVARLYAKDAHNGRQGTGGNGMANVL